MCVVVDDDVDVGVLSEERPCWAECGPAGLRGNRIKFCG